jgi:serine/threonine protein kinase
MTDKEKIFDHFFWKDVIQEDGDGGKVVICRKKAEETSEFQYVLKIRNKASIGSQKDQEEFRSMLVKMLNIPPHNGVMPYLEVLEDETHYYSVMEKASGGSLLSFLVNKHADGCVPELEMKQLMQELLHAVGHVHEQGMIHRDIKPNNIVIRKVDDPSNPNNGKVDRVTLIDFDHADTNYTPFTPLVWSDKIWGTTGFNAPETYLGQFSPASDLFSVGVTLYMLMTGKMPYDIKAIEKEIEQEAHGIACDRGRRKSTGSVSEDWCTQVYFKMQDAPVDWNCDPWPQNEACRKFCQSLLATKAQKRPASVEEALKLDWLADMPGTRSSSSSEGDANCKRRSCKDRLPPQGPRKKAQNLIKAIRATQGFAQDFEAPQPIVHKHLEDNTQLTDHPSQQAFDDQPYLHNKEGAPVQNVIEAMRALTLSPELEENETHPVLPVLVVNTKPEEEKCAPSAKYSEEIETEPETSLNSGEAETEADKEGNTAEYIEQHMAVLKRSELFQNRDFAFKIVPPRPVHRQGTRSQSCEQSTSTCEHVRVEQMLATSFASKPVRRKRDLFGMEGLTSQLAPLTPQTPQPFDGLYGMIPSPPRDMRRKLPNRPGRQLRSANSNSTWMRNGTR